MFAFAVFFAAAIVFPYQLARLGCVLTQWVFSLVIRSLLETPVCELTQFDRVALSAVTKVAACVFKCVFYLAWKLCVLGLWCFKLGFMCCVFVNLTRWTLPSIVKLSWWLLKVLVYFSAKFLFFIAKVICFLT
jgi:hypothetical protein